MKKFKCPFCGRIYIEKDALMVHMDSEHNDELHGLPPEQIYFNFTNKYALTKENGISVVSGRPTKFNIITCKYERFADERDRELYREQFKQRMMKVHGKETLLRDPEYQANVMLNNRKITKDYRWENGHITRCTGSYEWKFVEFLEDRLNWTNTDDLMAPAPQIIKYNDPDGVQRFHIPDFYIQSLNLIVNIKSKTNNHYRLRDIETERAQDEEIRKTKFNYIKIYENEFKEFTKIVDRISDDKETERVFLTESSQIQDYINGLEIL